MKFTVMFPMRAVKHFERWIGDGDWGDVAQVVEQAGFAGLGLSDHPFPDDVWLNQGGHHSLDPLVALSYAAAVTTKVSLITNVLVASYRHPYVVAKALATLDLLSGGRIVAGLGAGYLKPEFDVLGADFHRRGAYLDGAIQAMRSAWSGTDSANELFPAQGHTMLPSPLQIGGPPIWIGGNSEPARRRAVSSGDGWIPIAQSPSQAATIGTPALTSIDVLSRVIHGMQEKRLELEKPPLEVSFAPFEKRVISTGGVDAFCVALREQLGAYEDAGVSWLTVEPSSRNLIAFRSDVERLAEALTT